MPLTLFGQECLWTTCGLGQFRVWVAQGPIHNSTARLGVLLCFVFPFLKVCVRKVSKMAPEAIAKKNAMVNRKRNNFKRNGEAFDLGKQKNCGRVMNPSNLAGKMLCRVWRSKGQLRNKASIHVHNSDPPKRFEGGK